jgi:hypothetical protein
MPTASCPAQSIAVICLQLVVSVRAAETDGDELVLPEATAVLFQIMNDLVYQQALDVGAEVGISALLPQAVDHSQQRFAAL